MNIVKIEDGLLEQDSFFFRNRTTDFLGDAMFTRTRGELSILNGYIERNFNYKDFVIVIDKKPDILTENSKISIYTRKHTRRDGIEEIYDDSCLNSATNWKITQYNGFIQTYISFDNKKTWITCGGGQVREYAEIQGFYVEGDVPLRLTKYEVYRNPYVRLFDIDLGYVVKLVDDEENILDEQVSQYGDIGFFLGDNITAKFMIYDADGKLLKETALMDIKQGDSYANIAYDIDLYYGTLIEKYNTTKLNSLKEVIQIKNNSISDTYTDVVVRPFNENSDIVQLSKDGLVYADSITFTTLTPQEMRDIYISITKDKTVPSFGKRSFVLEIE